MRLLLVSAILRRDFTLHHVNRVSFKLFAYLFFFPIPLILKLSGAVTLVLGEATSVVLGLLALVECDRTTFW